MQANEKCNERSRAALYLLYVLAVAVSLALYMKSDQFSSKQLIYQTPSSVFNAEKDVIKQALAELELSLLPQEVVDLRFETLIGSLRDSASPDVSRALDLRINGEDGLPRELYYREVFYRLKYILRDRGMPLSEVSLGFAQEDEEDGLMYFGKEGMNSWECPEAAELAEEFANRTYQELEKKALWRDIKEIAIQTENSLDFERLEVALI